jgi:hypothetical protein
MVATTTAAQHTAQQNANAEFLQYACSIPRPTIAGSIASGATGGNNSPVVWTRVLPVSPRWIDEIELDIALPYQLTVPANATVYCSAYAPYSGVQQRLTIAGSPPWDYLSLVPFYLDEITRRQGYDPSLGAVSQAVVASRYNLGGLPAAQVDAGTWAYDTGNDNVIPGQALPVSTAAETYAGTMRFTGRIRLQRRRLLCFGMIPNGDPQDRPDLEMQLSPMVGPQPENSLFQDPANAGATCELTSAGTVNATYWSKGLDVLPTGVKPPDPTVGLGWAVTSFTTPINNSGQIVSINDNVAQLYQKIIVIGVNNQQPVDFNYWGNWLTGEQQNARWEYDAVGLGNMPSYWKKVLENYQRWLPAGVFINDMVGGDIPELPHETPYNGAMSPDESYATAFGIAFTPAMAHAVRIASGTSLSGAYVRTYAMGMVEVPY